MDDRSNVSVRNPAPIPALKRLAPSGVEHCRDSVMSILRAPKHGIVTAVNLTATRKQMREGGLVPRSANGQRLALQHSNESHRRGPTLPIQVVASEIAREVDEGPSPRDDSEWTEQQQTTEPRERFHQELGCSESQEKVGSDYDPEQRKELGRKGNSPMSVLGYCEPSNCTELWREKAITERAFTLISAKEWPPAVGWLDDLLSRDWIPPEGDFWEAVRRERRSVRLICKDGNRID